MTAFATAGWLHRVREESASRPALPSSAAKSTAVPVPRGDGVVGERRHVLDHARRNPGLLDGHGHRDDNGCGSTARSDGTWSTPLSNGTRPLCRRLVAVPCADAYRWHLLGPGSVGHARRRRSYDAEVSSALSYSSCSSTTSTAGSYSAGGGWGAAAGGSQAPLVNSRVSASMVAIQDPRACRRSFWLGRLWWTFALLMIFRRLLRGRRAGCW
jgi:hypothetical protein